MSSRIVTLAMDGEIAVISVNNPPVNTITAAARQGLFAALADIRSRAGIAAVVLVCEGSTFFSGADIGEFAGPPKEAEYRDLFRQLEQLPIPVVAGDARYGPWAAAWRSRWPVITAWRCRARASACPKSRSASFPAPAARSACRG